MIELRDAMGSLRKSSPDRLSYRIGLDTSGPPLTHSLGVALPNNEMQAFIEKGTPLPARRRMILKTEVDVKYGDNVDFLCLPVVEGGNLHRADRNMLIGTLKINASKIRRDIPAGSEIEVTIEIDQSRLIRTKAYIPWIDQEFEDVFVYKKEKRTPNELKAEADNEKKRLENVRQKAKAVPADKAGEALQRIDGERMVHDVDMALGSVQDDPDAADKCDKRLLDLRQAIDDVEDALEWPNLVRRAEKEIRDIKESIQRHSSSGDREMASALEEEVREAIRSHDLDLMCHKVSEISTLRIRIMEQPLTESPQSAS
jgi:molecular chaperone DnaK